MVMFDPIANKKAENIQEQLNQAIQDGNQLAETQQARVDNSGNPHATLKERIDNDVLKLNQKDSELTSQLAQIVTNANQLGADPLLADNTSFIQQALNKKGFVEITKPGVYVTGRLIIDDNTTFRLADGVVLKKKSGTNNYLIVNRGHIEGYRNKNIVLDGGEFDFNRFENEWTGSLWDNPQSWSGIGILFNGVDNLTIKNVKKAGNEGKYCYLITDIENFKAENIVFYNTSDGLHFQPPMFNVEIRNIRGWTEDDLISFTMGDYKAYSLGNYGNIENVLIENIYGEQSEEGVPTDELVKMVGSGADGLSEFKNIYIRNLGGYVGVYPVYIMREDLFDGNTTLKDTKINNVVIENVDVKLNNTNAYVGIGAVSGDITLRKMKLRTRDSVRMVHFTKANLDKVTFEDCHVPFHDEVNNVNWIIRAENSNIKQFLLNNCRMDVNSSVTNAIINSSDDGIEQLIIDHSIFNLGGTYFMSINGVHNVPKKIKITNSEINCGMFLSTNAETSIFLSNTVIKPTVRAFTLADGGHLKVDASESIIENAGINGVTEVRSISLNGKNIKYMNRLSTLTGRVGDIIDSSDPTEPIKGIVKFNGDKWVRVNDIVSDVYEVTIGTVEAGSVKEVTINFGTPDLNKEVIVTPQFVLPNGVFFQAYNRDTSIIRLRVFNATNSNIIFDSLTQKDWYVRVRD